MTAFRWGSQSHKGQVRRENQDSALVVADRLFAVADGMGGHQGGEVASAMALDVLEGTLEGDGAGTTTKDLIESVRKANASVFARATDQPELKGMGTTLCALAPVEGGERLGIVNVGDSRVYRLRGGTLEQITQDHSLVADLVREGRITEEEAASHPQRNVVTRALGIDKSVKIDAFELDAVAGDRYLLCSDGLFNEVDLNRIAATVRRFDDPADAARELVRLANEGGGRDNITSVVVHVVDGGGGDGAAVDSVGGGEATGMLPAVAGAPEPTGDHEPVPGDEGAPPVDGPSPGADEPPGGTSDRADPTVVAAPDDLGVDDADGEPELRPRRLTWRVAGFTVLLLVVLAATVGAIGWYARYTYYVGFDGDTVAIFQGRPGGFLWWDDTLEETTDIDRDDVPASQLADLESGRDQATLADARRYVENLEDQVAEAAAATSTTTTSTTTTTTPDRRDSGGGTGGTRTAPPPGGA